MSGVSAAQRAAAWNVHFLDNTTNAFAGLFQLEDMVTYRDAFQELRLCFQLDQYSALTLWRVDPSEDQTFDDICISSISLALLDRPIALRAAPAKKTRYSVSNHSSAKCSLNGEADIQKHVSGGCAEIIEKPAQRYHDFYRNINKRSDHPNLPPTPRRGSRSPKKRSGSQSPNKRALGEVPELGSSQTEETQGPMPETIPFEEAKRLQNSFRLALEARSRKCAISGLGEGWANLTVGPGMQACHIVPDYAWDLYPLPIDQEQDGNNVGSMFRSRRQDRRRYENTWAATNGIWMQSSIHAVHDARLLAIHPKSSKIRVFAPYDLVTAYHNKPAFLDEDCPPDPAALKFQMECCIIENMTASYLWIPVPTGIQSPISAESTESEGGSKRRRLEIDTVLLSSTRGRITDMTDAKMSSTRDGNQDTSGETHDNESLPDLTVSTLKTSPESINHFFGDSDGYGGSPTYGMKRKRFDLEDSYITPDNAPYFLADVNYELKRHRRF